MKCAFVASFIRRNAWNASNDSATRSVQPTIINDVIESSMMIRTSNCNLSCCVLFITDFSLGGTGVIDRMVRVHWPTGFIYASFESFFRQVIAMMDGVAGEAHGLDITVPKLILGKAWTPFFQVVTQVRLLGPALPLAFSTQRIHSQV
jgi:hypothetical protein